jgi:hypothetical protein
MADPTPAEELIQGVRRGLLGFAPIALQAAREAAAPCWAWLLSLGAPLFGYPLLVGDPRTQRDPITVLADFSPLLDEAPETSWAEGGPFEEYLVGLLLGAWLTSGLVAWSLAKEGWQDGDRGPGLGRVRRAGKGLFRSCLALMLVRSLLGSLVLFLLASLPISLVYRLGEDALGPLGVVLMLAVLGLFGLGLLYVLTLDAALWLALYSLAANRRGAGSAFQHAWRLLNHDPARAIRAVGLYGGVIGLGYGLLLPLLLSWSGDYRDFVGAMASGIFGWWSVRYWLHGYRALGGVQTAAPGPDRRAKSPAAQPASAAI